MDQDLADVTRLDQAHVPESFAPVVGPVDTVPPGRTLAVVLLPRSDVQDVGIRRGDRHVSERADRLIGEDVAPGVTPVGGLPQSSGRRRDEDRGRIVRKRFDVVHASSRYGRSDQAGPEGGELRLGDAAHLIRGCRLRDGCCRGKEETGKYKQRRWGHSSWHGRLHSNRLSLSPRRVLPARSPEPRCPCRPPRASTPGSPPLPPRPRRGAVPCAYLSGRSTPLPPS